MNRTLSLVWLVVIVWGTAFGPAAEGRREDAWDKALAQVGLTRATARFDALILEQFGGEISLPLVKMMHHEPLRIPTTAEVMRRAVLLAAENPAALVAEAARELGVGSRRTLLRDPLAAAEKGALHSDPLFTAIAELHASSGRPLGEKGRGLLRRRLKSVPAAVQKQAAFLLLAEQAALVWRDRALADLKKGRDLGLVFQRLASEELWNEDEPLEALPRSLLRHVDLKALMAGAEDLALAAARVEAALRKLPDPGKFRFEWDTPLGRIALNGTGEDNRYAFAPHQLLTLDLGGNDTYYAGGGTSDATHPISVVIDLAGDDKYLETAKLAEMTVGQWKERGEPSGLPRFGAGVLGYGILIDSAGNDLYRTGSHALGRAFLGVGVLIDRGGNDTYECVDSCLGSAELGVGIVADLDGNDRYDSGKRSQGFGGPRGVGLLLDRGEGADRYQAGDEAQGAAYGFRGEVHDGHSAQAGIGILVEGGGENSFRAGSFAQGAAYWYGLGLLSGGPGKDTYEAGSHAQGAGKHYGVGVLDETGGDDIYKVTKEIGQGSGHDFAVGFLIDRAGNDQYQAPAFSLGSGRMQGFGVLWDRKGEDRYVSTARETLGWAGGAPPEPTLRAYHPTIGLFVDSGGSDKYETAFPAGNDNEWVGASTEGAEVPSELHGAGLDLDRPETPNPW